MFYISCTLRARGLTRESLLSAAAGGGRRAISSAEHLVVCAVRLHRYLGAGALLPLIRQFVSIESALLYHARLRFAYIFHVRASPIIYPRALAAVSVHHQSDSCIVRACALTGQPLLRVRVDII